MSKIVYGSEYSFQTRAVHTGNDIDSETVAIKRPIKIANSYELPTAGLVLAGKLIKDLAFRKDDEICQLKE